MVEGSILELSCYILLAINRSNTTESSLSAMFKPILVFNFQPREDASNVLLNTRGMELAIVKVGGFNGISGVTNEISYYLPSSNKWKYLTSVPHVEQCNFGVAVLYNELFVVGGCFNQSLEENVHPFGFKYNPLTNSWSTIAPMQQERCRFTLAVIDNFIYAIAGAGEMDTENGESALCEMYDPVTDTWTPTAPVPGGYRTQHAAATWRNYIFVSGGLDQDLVLDSLLRYNSMLNVWEAKAHMLMPRADHSIHCYNDKLFVCGGWYEDEITGMRVLVDTIDCYDIETDTWTVVTRIPTPRYHAGSVIYGSWLYIIGGFHSDNTFDRCTSVIECYDIESNSWCSVDDYPQDIWEHVCSTLYIPRCRDDLEVIANKSS
ncbi:kelch-like protein 26 [Dinothrombium tinctorium]|uniref:Kelch-like protein 26 n=1 Tax=Dinothrombium tinctorium TaxID=1965070 RepID=A0A3S3Q6N2_9ACAR|nr:kelch-like protein 26 [Dinothrombium tinctorium]